MEDVNVIEGGKIIADFMEVKYEVVNNTLWHPVEIKGIAPYSIKLEYHSDWNLLMGVCEKICEIDNCADIEFAKELEKADLQILHRTSILCNKQGVYERVLEFIKWYNHQQSK